MPAISRQRMESLVDQHLLHAQHVTVIGAGATGSNTVYQLVKLGVGSISVYDDDVVAPENLMPQFYAHREIGRDKVRAIETMARRYTNDVQVSGFTHRWGRDAFPGPLGIVVSCVDTMESRRDIIESLFPREFDVNLFIDTRMGLNVIEVYAVHPGDLARFLDEAVNCIEPMEVPCSGRAASYNGPLVASLVSRIVAAHTAGQPVPKSISIDLLAWFFNASFSEWIAAES